MKKTKAYIAGLFFNHLVSLLIDSDFRGYGAGIVRFVSNVPGEVIFHISMLRAELCETTYFLPAETFANSHPSTVDSLVKLHAQKVFEALPKKG